MKALRVLLFISFLLVAVFALIGLFSPGTLSSMGMTAKDADPAYTRVFATGWIGFALAIWYTFRDPAKNVIVVRAMITWFGLEALVLLISGIGGSIPWKDALPGVISDGILAVLLGVFYPRAKKSVKP